MLLTPAPRSERTTGGRPRSAGAVRVYFSHQFGAMQKIIFRAEMGQESVPQKSPRGGHLSAKTRAIGAPRRHRGRVGR
jgi:hypothetical protein